MTNNQFKTKNKLALAITLLIALAALTTLNSQFASAIEDHETTTVTIFPATGGTTSVAPGDHSYVNNTVLSITATPNVGYEFLYWNITGIMNTGDDHDTMGTDPQDMGHGGPFGELSDLESLILTNDEVTITIDCSYRYQYQAFFAPSQNASPTGTSNVSNQQALSSDNTLTYIAIGSVGGIIGVAAVVGILMKRNKQSNALPVNPL